MKADLSRGHRPDRKRGKDYRRVLLQQGRLLLDSDLAAATDALDTGLRTLARDVAGESGTRDQGFLITPGRLMALFETLDGVTRDGSSQAPFKHYLDFGRRYQRRLPSLYLGGLFGWGKVTVALRSAPRPSTKLRLWACLPTGTKLVVGLQGLPDQQVTGVDAQLFKPYDIIVPVGSSVPARLDLSFANTAASPDPSREAWIGLIEEFETAAGEPRFWVKQGHYLLGGHPLTLEADGSFPSVSFPTATGAGMVHGAQATPEEVSPGQRFLAFLEGWERLITHVEDPGLLEQALGGTLDTCVRTQAVGQVKLVACPSGPTPAQLVESFRERKAPQGTLQISTASQSTSADPCAIPEVEGYTGGDNRLYRFEVHEWTQATGLGSFILKWSRNNGAEVFRVVSKTDSGSISRLGLAPGADLRDGDLVEFLDESVELGDRTPAELDAAGFTPSRRAVGTLYYVREVLEAPGQIELVDPSTSTSVWLPYTLSEAAIPKLRRWHGLLKPEQGTASSGGLVFTVDGIEVTLGGPAGGADLFRPGDYWQYEARRLYANDNGAWVASPHGPERVFAPLALFEFQGTDQPVELIEWYGGRGSPLFELEADDVAFNGARAGSTSTTVQGALDELFERQGSGCCQVELGPEPSPTDTTDDAARIENLLQTTPALSKGGVICLQPGVYYFRTQLALADASIELRGRPGVVLASDAAGQSPLQVGAGGSLTLSGLVLCTWSNSPGPALIELTGDASLTIKECGLFHPGPKTGSVNPGTVILTPGTVPDAFVFSDLPYEVPYPLPTFPSAMSAPRIQIDDSVILAGWGIVARNLKSLRMHGTISHCRNGVVYVQEELSQVYLSRSGLYTEFPDTAFDQIRTKDPTTVEEFVRSVLETGWDYVLPSGTAFRVRDLFGGVVTESYFYGSLGFCARLAYMLELRGNFYTGTNGLRLDNVAESRVIGENIHVQFSGRYDEEGFPDGSPIGILVLRSAFQLLIADCTVHAEGVGTYGGGGGGIVLATRHTKDTGSDESPEPEPPQSRRFHDVQVCGNFIRATAMTAIQVRDWADSEAGDSLPDRISICDNDIEQRGMYGILYRYRSDFSDSAVGAPRVLIARNRIDLAENASFGITVFEVRSNILAVEDNIILGQYSSGNYYYLMYGYAAEEGLLRGNLLHVSGSIPASGYLGEFLRFQSCHGMRFVGNSMGAGANNGSLIPINAYNCNHMVVRGNEWGTFNQYANFYLSADMVFDGNKLRAPVSIDWASGGCILSNNLIEANASANSAVYEDSALISGTHLLVQSDQNTNLLVTGNRINAGYLVVRPNAGSSEYSMVAQIEGNFANALTIGNYTYSTSPGYSNGFYPPNAASRVMVTNNQAKNLIKVNSYAKLLMANNMAPTLKHGTTDVGSTTLGPVNNLKA